MNPGVGVPGSGCRRPLSDTLGRGCGAGSLARVKRNITCPCGEQITGQDEDDLVAKTQAHLKEKHPGHDYSRDEILFMAY